MSTQLLEIEPEELKFIFELNERSSCSVRLTNNSSHTVAFKVKTAAPKRYAMRPIASIVLPKSTCEVTAETRIIPARERQRFEWGQLPPIAPAINNVTLPLNRVRHAVFKQLMEFVKMNAQKVAPPDMECKDKFLIQSTVVAVGISAMDITSLMFSKDGDKLVEEVKLKVVLISSLGQNLQKWTHADLSPITKSDHWRVKARTSNKQISY